MGKSFRPPHRVALWHYFEGDSGDFVGWYANIEDPHVRKGRTTRSRDHVLDFWVEPDRLVERKDEDELVRAVEQGRHRPDDADAIRATAAEIEDVIRQWAAPFSDRWDSFRPDPSWPVPALFATTDGPETSESSRLCGSGVSG